MALFQEIVGANHYDGMIDWIGEEFGGGNVSVDPNAMTVTIDDEVTKVDVCIVIPAMKAGKIAEIAGVTDGNWAPVNAADMSTKADADVYVLGDVLPSRAICQNQASPLIAKRKYVLMRFCVHSLALKCSLRVSPIRVGH